jgi:hypothetical protein
MFFHVQTKVFQKKTSSLVGKKDYAPQGKSNGVRGHIVSDRTEGSNARNASHLSGAGTVAWQIA